MAISSGADFKKFRKAVVFGHADADGHIAAVQTRANLRKAIPKVDIVVTKDTINYRFWEKAFCDWPFAGYDLVVCVDIAFSFREPTRSLDALLDAAARHPAVQFVVVDHHKLQQPEARVPNLELIETDSVYDCCLGKPSPDLMVVAAICDGDSESVSDLITWKYQKRALGVRRAAADVSGLAGPQLLSLIENQSWDFFEDLAEEAPSLHRSARGRRINSLPSSPLLEAAKNGSL